jgi:hypothetical protein
MSDPASFSWICTGTGNWNAPTNWADVTTGQTPAVVAPGRLDAAIFRNSGTAVAVSGNGNAASISVQGTDAVQGTLNAGTLIVDQPGSLDINTAATISATTAADLGSILVNGSGAALLVHGTLQIGTASLAGDLEASGGGFIQTGDLIMTNAMVVLYSSSAIELGSAGTADAATVTIDPGYTLSGSGTVTEWGLPVPQLDIVDNGLISSTALTLGGYEPIVGPLYPGVPPVIINVPDVTLSGTGTVEVQCGGTVSLAASVSTPGLTFQLDGNAQLYTAGGMVAGTAINLDGTGNSLFIGTDPELDDPPAIDATINGFNAADTIIFDNQTISSATLAGGSLVVAFGPYGDTTTTLELTGNYSSDGVRVLSGDEVVLTSDTYSWIGPTSGNWNTATDWVDVTTGQTPAVVAPGSLDAVIFANSGAAVTVSGNGAATSTTMQGTVDVLGTLNAGTLVADQPAILDINAGATISAATATDRGTILVGGSASALLVNGMLQIGTVSLAGDLDASAGGFIQTGNLSLGASFSNIVTVDSASTIEVGNAGSAAVGTFTVDPGYTISGQGSLLGNLTDNGLIAGDNLTLGQAVGYSYGAPASVAHVGYYFSTALSGTGTVEIQPGGTIDLAEPIVADGPTFQLDGSVDLDIQASIASGNTINLIGNANTITVDGAYYTPEIGLVVTPGMPAVDATINGFNNTDTLIVVGATSDFSGPNLPVLLATYADSALWLEGFNKYVGSYQVLTLDLPDLPPDTTFSVGNMQPRADPALPAGAVQQAITIAPPISCFAAGTRIATPRGAVPVSRLRDGDTVLTASGQPQPIRWVGRRRVDCRRHPAPAQVMPIRIVRGAFRENMPQRALLLSPDHSIFIDGVLIPVKYLVNGTTIAQVPMAEMTYYHVELPHHDLLLAEGMQAESYLDVGDRSNFVNGGGLVKIQPNFTLDEACEAIWETAGCAPLRIAGDEFNRVAARLRKRATLLGYAWDRMTRPPSRPRAVKATDPAQLLDPAWYLANNPDVAVAGVDAAEHYVTWGRQEGRLPCHEIDLVLKLGLVDAGTVAFTMADIIAAGIDPVAHFCSIGWRERRRPNPYFDTGWYLDTHDVPAGMNPLLHYVLLGEPRGLPPSPHFDPAWYRDRYAIGVTPSPLAHYLKHRRSQRFSPRPTFDVAAYIKVHAVTLRPDRDPYAHFLVVGRFAQIRRDRAGHLAA